MTTSLTSVLQPLLHYSMHFLVPGLLAWIFFRTRWKRAWLIMIATMLVDLDHIWACRFYFAEAGALELFSCPDLFVPDRCSLAAHPLHSPLAMAGYGLMLLVPRLRIVATGLLFHMLTDGIDCLWM